MASVGPVFSAHRPSYAAPAEADPAAAEAASKFDNPREIKIRISANCLKKLQEHLGNYGLLEKSGNRQWGDWEKGIEHLQRMIQNPEATGGADANDQRKWIQNQVCELLKDEAYLARKEDESNPFVHFLHIAAEIIHNQSEGMSVFASYGEHLLGPLDDRTYGIGELIELMQKAVSLSSEANVNSVGERVRTHAIFHPLRALETLRSESAGEEFNTAGSGNYNATLGTFQIGPVSVRTSAGPNPSYEGYTIFSALQQRNRNLHALTEGKGPKHLQGILEGAESKSGAKKRRDSVIDKEDQQVFFAMSLPLDGEAWKAGGRFAEVRSLKDFISLISAELNQQHSSVNADGFRIPPELLSRERISSVINHFHEAFIHLIPGDEQFSRQEFCKTLLLGLNACFIVEGIRALAQHSSEVDVDGLSIQPTCNIACKQGIDRGAIQNLIVRILLDARQNGRFKFSRSQIYEYCGYIAGRAASVEQRQIQKDRFEAIPHFLSLVAGNSEEAQRQFLDHLEISDMQFIPSHGIRQERVSIQDKILVMS